MAQDTGIIILLSIGSIVAGSVISYILTTKTPWINWLIRKFKKEDRERNKILNNPELLKAKLEDNGGLVDAGEKVSYEVVEKDGVKILEERRRPLDQSKSYLQGEDISFCQECQSMTKTIENNMCGKCKTSKGEEQTSKKPQEKKEYKKRPKKKGKKNTKQNT